MHRSDQLRLPATTAILVAAVACTSDGTSPPSTAQGIRVSVATAGFHPDPDGYTVKVGARETTVGADGTVTFEELQPGSYSVQLTGVQENCAASEGTSVDVVLAEGETKSVSFDITCVFDMSGAVLPVVSCPGLAPAADHGLPGDEIALGALPAALQAPLFARVSWAGGEEAALTFVDPASTALVAPLHPGGLLAGGVVAIRITDAARACAPFTFTVDPLQPAPGEFASVVDLWQELLEAQAAMAGVTVADLVSRPMDDFPFPVHGLHLSQRLLDHPEEPNSLRAIEDGRAPAFAGLDQDYLDAVLALTGMREALERRIVAAGEGVVLLKPAAGASAAIPIVTAIDCLMGIADEEALETCMTLARDKIVGPIEEAYLQDLGNVLNFVGTLPIEYPPAKAMLQVISGFVLLEKHYSELLAGALPSDFVSIEVTPKPPYFNEDTPGPGSWAPAMVVARSNGYSTTELLQDVMIEALKVTDSYNDFMKAAGENAAAQWAEQYFGGQVDEMVEAFLTNVISFYGSETVKGVFKASLEGPGLPAQNFGPIPLSSEQYVTSRMVLDEFVVRTGHDEMDPRKPGTDYLHVITAEGRFGGVNIQTDPPVPIEVRQIEMQFWEFSRPTQEIYVAAGESVDLKLAVRNSDFPGMVQLEPLPPEWGSAALTVGDGDTEDGWTVHSVIYTAPDDVQDLNGLLTATHTATSGARQHGGALRKAEVRLLPLAVTITTEPTCLEPGDSLFIEVDLKGMDGATLLWTADAGTIRQDGLFIASDELPQVKVTVALADNPAVSDFIYLDVGGCTCQGTLSLDGVTPDTERLTFYLTNDLAAVREVAWHGPLSTASFTFGGTPGLEEPVTLGATGTFPAVGGGYVNGVGNFGNFANLATPPMSPLSGHISENEAGNLLAGTISGWVLLQDVEDPVTFTLTYRIAADPLYSTATERRCYVTP